MNVPKGYKMTEVGLIPEDWEVKKLGDIAEMASGGTPLTSNPNYYNGDIPWVSISDMTKGGKHIFATDKYITQLGFNNSACKIFPIGTVLYAMYASLGECSIAGIPLCSSQAILGIRVKENLDNEFLYYYLNYIKNTVKGYGQQGTQPNLNKEIVQNFQIKLPLIDEQRSIAQVLSDTDELINALDKLIAKKRDIKKAVMQELLTGKTRLPGFSGEWEVKRLGDLLDYEQPTNYLVKDAKYSDTNSIPVLTAGKTFILGYTDEDFGIFQDLPVIIFDDFTTASRYVDFPFKVKSSAMKMLKAKTTQINLRLVYELMQMIDFPIADHKRHWIKQYQNIEIVIPHPAEQQAIAQVLSDIDSEITALEKRRDKMKAIKQGMMQELLTGRIRLK